MERRPNRRAICLALILLSSVVLLADFAFPLGVAAGVPYVAVVLLSLWIGGRRPVLVAASGASVLTVLGFFVPFPEGSMIWIGLENRAIALFTIWATAILAVLLVRKEEVVRQERDFNESLVETASSVILLVDAEDKILHYNRFAAEITGYPLAETRGKDWAEVFLPESERARARSLLERCAPGSAGGDNLLPFLTKRGQRRVFSWGGRILRKEDGAPIGTLYVGQDITPLIEAQEKAVRSGRLAAMGQTIAALSHEVRNELLGLRFILRSLDKRMVDDVTRGLVARLRDVESRLSRMFEDLRGFAAPIRLERSPASVADAWRSAWASLKHKHGDDAELIEQTAEADLHCPIDPLRVEQVFRNLFENSLAASPPPVRLVVTCSEVSDADKRMLRVSVRDNGPGLPPEVRDRVFEPFFTTKSEGTGLGMPICRRIIEEHGGELRVGEPGPGAEFVILLPKAEAPRSAAPSPHSTATARANGRSGER